MYSRKLMLAIEQYALVSARLIANTISKTQAAQLCAELNDLSAAEKKRYEALQKEYAQDYLHFNQLFQQINLRYEACKRIHELIIEENKTAKLDLIMRNFHSNPFLLTMKLDIEDKPDGFSAASLDDFFNLQVEKYQYAFDIDCEGDFDLGMDPITNATKVLRKLIEKYSEDSAIEDADEGNDHEILNALKTYFYEMRYGRFIDEFVDLVDEGKLKIKLQPAILYLNKARTNYLDLTMMRNRVLDKIRKQKFACGLKGSSSDPVLSNNKEEEASLNPRF